MTDAVLLDTITKTGDVAGRIVLAASHGGVYAAYLAARARARAVILHDAGIGLEEAGVACIGYCQRLAMAAATVDHMSARIGDAQDMARRGRISRANAVAVAAGVAPAMMVADALAALERAPMWSGEPPVYAEGRHEVIVRAGADPVLCVDSASMVEPAHRGRIIATGSHGGLIGADPANALRADARAALFNDAGVGIDGAGTTRLPALEGRGIAAVTVSAASARIGDGRSTLHDGVLSALNARAAAAGARVGMPAIAWVQAMLR